MITKPATVSEPIHDIIQNRWSPRAFDAEQPIDNAVLTAILEAARWSPSCMNEQPWRFLVCVKASHPTAWQQLLSSLGEKNQQWAQYAPVLILAIAVDNFSQSGKPNRWAAYDTGAAVLSLSLQATSLGLVTHQMGGFDSEACRQLFQLPEHCTPMSVIALGYQAEAEQLPDELKQRELAERSRAPLSERCYFGQWI